MKETCKICERVYFGDIVKLPGGEWRHEACSIGSEEYVLYYAKLSKADKAKLADLHRCFYPNI